MATITNRTDRNVFAGRRLAAAGVVRKPGAGFASDNVVRWSKTRRGVADQVDAAYAEARQVIDEDRRIVAERAAIEARFHAARNWTERARALQAARDFDEAHPSRDPLFDELHADQMYGLQYPEAA